MNGLQTVHSFFYRNGIRSRPFYSTCHSFQYAIGLRPDSGAVTSDEKRLHRNLFFQKKAVPLQRN